MAIDYNQPWEPVFCLRINARGTYFYVATEEVVLVDSDGNEYAHQSGLEPLDWTYSLQLGQFSSRSQSVGVSFTNPFPQEFLHTISCWALDVATMEGELSLYINGNYEDRIILASGRLQRLKWAYEGESMSASLLVNPFRYGARVPNPMLRVTTAAFASATDDVLGVGYPLIFGSPGTSDKPSHPAIRISATQVLVAGHHVPETVCSLWNRTTGVTASPSVTNTTDALGNAVALATYTAAEGDEVWVSGLSGVLSNPADMIANLLDLAGIPYVSPVGLRGHLEPYRLGFVLNEQTECWNLMQDRILPLLPLSYQLVGGDTVEFQYIKPLPVINDVVAYIDVQRGDACLLDSPEVVENDLANRITVRYAPDASLSGVDQSIALTGFDEGSGVTNNQLVSPDANADYSQSRLGVFEREISTDAVWDRATAGRLAYDQLELYGFPPIVATYQLLENLAWVRPGDIISITDSDFNWTNKLFRIQDLTLNYNGVTAQIASLEHPNYQTIVNCAAPTFPPPETELYPTENLVINGSFEDDAGATTTLSGAVSPTSWDVDLDDVPLVVAYDNTITFTDSPHGTITLLKTGDTGTSGHGDNYVLMGTDGGNSTVFLYQTIEIDSAYLSDVDAGLLVANFSAWLGYCAVNSNITLYLRAMNASFDELASELITGPAPGSGRLLEFEEDTLALPSGTRYLFIEIASSIVAGADYVYTCIDDVSVVIDLA